MKPNATPYQIVFSIDPIWGGRIPIGAMLIVGHAVEYVARTEIPTNLRPSLRAAVGYRCEALGSQRHPWEIGPEVAVEGRMHFMSASFGDPREWIRNALNEDMFGRLG